MVRNWVSVGLVLLGFIQVVGYLAKQSSIRGFGALTVASPLPLVFTEVRGIETFAQDFYFGYPGEDSEWVEVQITPELYGQLEAPYQYRNVLGAAISYGSVLPESLWKPVLDQAFIHPGEVSKILGLAEPPKRGRIRIVSRTLSKPNQYVLEFP